MGLNRLLRVILAYISENYNLPAHPAAHFFMLQRPISKRSMEILPSRTL